MSDNDTKAMQHPSFGAIRVGRVTGSTRLVGSDAQDHMSYVNITISRAEVIDGDSSDLTQRVFPKTQLISIDLSPAQWCDLLMSWDRHEGVPCTLRRVQGEQMPRPPMVRTPRQRAKELFKERVSGTVANFTSVVDAARKTVEGSPLSKKARAELTMALDTVLARISSDIPFYVDTFSEATEKMTQVARAEFDALVSLAKDKIANMPQRLPEEAAHLLPPASSEEASDE